VGIMRTMSRKKDFDQTVAQVEYVLRDISALPVEVFSVFGKVCQTPPTFASNRPFCLQIGRRRAGRIQISCRERFFGDGQTYFV